MTNKIKCGNCKQYHDTVGQVKDCYANRYDEDAQAKAELEAERRAERFFEEGTEAQQAQYQHEVEMDEQRALFPTVQDWAALKSGDEESIAAEVLDQMTGAPGKDMASDNQVRYALDLLARKEWPDQLNELDLRNMERRQVTKLINSLKLAKSKPIIIAVPTGKYALVEDGKVRFYQVECPDKGRWAGYVFVKELFGSPGSFTKSTLGRVRREATIRMITEMGPAESSALFGKELGICGVCGSPLTNEESRAVGIGPKCRAKRGW